MPDFKEKVLKIVKKIPKGKVLTYNPSGMPEKQKIFDVPIRYAQ